MRTLVHFLLLLSVIFLNSCDKNESDPVLIFSINKQEITVSAAGVKDSILLSSSVAWTAEGLPSWIQSNTTSGSDDTKIVFTIEPNRGLQSRTANITFKGSGVPSQVVKVTQAASAPFVSVDKTSLQVAASGQKDSIVVTSNVKWTLTSNGWIHSDNSSGDSGTTKVLLTCDVNTSSGPRQGEILISSVSQPIKISVLQNAPIVDPADKLKEGLIAYYPFNGNANDESGNNYHMTVRGATLSVDRFSNVSKAFSFNGVDAFLQIPKILKADSLREFTLSMWVKTEKMYNTSIVSFLPSENADLCTSTFGFDITPRSQQTLYKIVTASNPNNCTTAMVWDTISNPLSKWSHLVLVQRYDPNPVFTTYLYSQFFNGLKLARSGAARNPIPTSLSHGGVVGCNILNYFDFFGGSVDDLRIYDRALSDAEVQQLYSLPN